MTTRESEIIGLIQKEVKPALGCTEPIAVALAVAKAMENADKQIRSAQELNKKRLEQMSKTLMDRIERAQRSLGARIDENACPAFGSVYLPLLHSHAF